MNKQQLVEELKQIAILRHSKWDELGLMSTRVYLKEQLSLIGTVEEHYFHEGSESIFAGKDYEQYWTIVKDYWEEEEIEFPPLA